MKRTFLPGLILAAGISMTAGLVSCSKSDSPATGQPIEKVQTEALNDFVNQFGNPLYSDFTTEATTLDNAVKALAQSPSIENQQAARTAWKAVRQIWEISEGFLIGPVDDNNYDPNMDTWPTDRKAIDALLLTNPNITSEQLDNTDGALKGFHPLEYLLWETKPSEYTHAEKQYMAALSENILKNVKALQNSWLEGGFGAELSNPGSEGSRYGTQKEALEAIANALITICDEVGDGKIPDPFGNTEAEADSTKSESPYSHNSILDFKNNIRGALMSYTCDYPDKPAGKQPGVSLSTLVQVNNKSLDTKIKAAFNNAIKSFDGFNNANGGAGITFEMAIYKNRSVVQNVIDQINALRQELENGLVPYIQQYVKN